MSIQVKPCRLGVKNKLHAVLEQNRVHRINTRQTMSTRIQNEF
jgi:hypothetical protein